MIEVVPSSIGIKESLFLYTQAVPGAEDISFQLWITSSLLQFVSQEYLASMIHSFTGPMLLPLPSAVGNTKKRLLLGPVQDLGSHLYGHPWTSTGHI